MEPEINLSVEFADNAIKLIVENTGSIPVSDLELFITEGKISQIEEYWIKNPSRVVKLKTIPSFSPKRKEIFSLPLLEEDSDSDICQEIMIRYRDNTGSVYEDGYVTSLLIDTEKAKISLSRSEGKPDK
ncbi:MAG TPA: hypothetical protein P5253_05460, partial [bacterium]|nr:hypothetical protein [bacterium]